MDTLFLARYGVLMLVLLIALYTDISQRKIFNWLTFPAIGLGLGFTVGELLLFKNVAVLQGLLIGVSITALVFGIPTWLGWLGGGDFKLVMAVATLTAGRQTLEILFSISLVGAVMALLTLIWKGSMLKGLRGMFRLISKPRSSSITDENEITIPYGIAISLGTLLPILFFFFTQARP